METGRRREGNLGAFGDFSGLGSYRRATEMAALELKKENIVKRIWRKDHTVWNPEPEEIADRLGWLDSPEFIKNNQADIEEFVSSIRKEEYKKAVLLGMGGSSLAPDVFRQVFGVKEGYLDLEVLDSTHPDAILEVSGRLDLSRTLFIVSTKSGGTVETLSLFKYFYDLIVGKVGREKTSEHFAAITDPGSGLETLARNLGLRKIFLNDPSIGGRYSALSFFGLVPACLVGVDLSKIHKSDRAMADLCSSADENPGAALGTTIGELARLDRDKLTLVLSPKIAPFGAWVEQLIAESTGKSGKGILPIVGEELISADGYSEDRLFIHIQLKAEKEQDKKIEQLAKAGHPVVRIKLDEIYDLGGEFIRWEMATAIAGWRIGIHPFNQPNVESAKVLAREMVETFRLEGTLPEEETAIVDGEIRVIGSTSAADAFAALREFLGLSQKERSAGPYVAIQAYLNRSPKTDEILHLLRTKIQRKYRLATTVGYGPRFLHSTGQLHKGDAGNGLFIIFTDDPAEDLPIPDEAGGEKSGLSFGVLIAAQAAGDRRALTENKRRVIQFHLGSNANENIKLLTDSLT